MTLKYFEDCNHPGWLSFIATIVVIFILGIVVGPWAVLLLAIGLAIYMYKWKDDEEE